MDQVRPSTADDEGELDRIEGPRVGGRLGPYLVLRELGPEGTGAVYDAYDPKLDRRLAIKVLGCEGLGARARERLLREARAMTLVSHPNVVSIFDVATFEGQLHLVMEFVEGATLSEWMAGAQAREWQEVLPLFMAIGRGLVAAHEAGLVHRDFRPQSVLLTAEGVPKVTNFGLIQSARELSLSLGASGDVPAGEVDALLDDLAGVLGGLGGLGESADEGLPFAFGPEGSIAGVEAEAVGSSAYGSPEQFMGEAVDARADQFSFCVALHVALWGTAPFAEDADRDGEPDPDSGFDEREGEAQLNPARHPRDRRVPGWLGPVIDRGLAQDPNDRWPSMAELLTALNQDPARRRRRWLAGGVAVALVLGSSLGAWQLEAEARAACTRAAEGAQRRWSEEARTRVREAMLTPGASEAEDSGGRTGASYAEDSWGRTQAGLDSWVSDWGEARGQACAARSKGGAPRERCLDEALMAAEASIAVLGEVDRVSMAEAVDIVANLPAPRDCERGGGPAGAGASLDERRGDQGDPPRRALARAKALLASGRYAEAQALAGEVAAAGGSRVSSLEASALVGWGALHAGDYDEARERLEAAHYGASALGLDRVAFDAALGRVALSRELGEFEFGELWARHAGALCERMGAQGRDQAALHLGLGRLRRRAGAFEGAEAELRRAAVFVAESYPPGHPMGAAVALERGEVARWRGDYAQARERLEEARTSLLTSVGGEHPRLAEVESALGEVERQSGDLRAARRRFEAALDIQTRAFGRHHPAVVETLRRLAMVLGGLGHGHPALSRQREAAQLASELASGLPASDTP